LAEIEKKWESHRRQVQQLFRDAWDILTDRGNRESGLELLAVAPYQHWRFLANASEFSTRRQLRQWAEEYKPRPRIPTLELRGHHLFTLSQVEFMRAHKSEFIAMLLKNIKTVQCRLLGYGNGRDYAEHLVDTVLAISRGDVDEVRIVDDYDAVCEKCPQKGDGKCFVAGRSIDVDLIKLADEAVARNSQGALEIGQTYSPEYLRENMGKIRQALRKTLLELPKLQKRL
jgi:hypothetical protein